MESSRPGLLAGYFPEAPTYTRGSSYPERLVLTVARSPRYNFLVVRGKEQNKEPAV